MLAGTKAFPFGEACLEGAISPLWGDERGVLNSATESRVIAEGILAQLNKEQIIRIPENPEIPQVAARNVSDNSATKKEQALSLYVHPNPAYNSIEVNYTLSEYSQHSALEITDIALGKIIYTQPLNSEQTAINIDVSHLNSGFYIVHLRDKGAILKSQKVSIIK